MFADMVTAWFDVCLLHFNTSCFQPAKTRVNSCRVICQRCGARAVRKLALKTKHPGASTQQFINQEHGNTADESLKCQQSGS